METKLLALLFASREHFLELEKYQVKESLSELAKALYELAAEFYTTDTKATQVDIELIRTRIARELPRQKELLFAAINNLPTNVSAPNIFKEVLAVKKENLARALSSTLLSPSKEGADNLIEEYRNLDSNLDSLRNNDDVILSPSVEDIFSELKAEKRIRLWPSGLNEVCGGGAVRGHNILVFGRPEVGKSAFVINMVGGFLHDGHRVLFIENEDPGKVTVSRIMCRLSEMTLEEIQQDYAKATKMCDKRNIKNLVFKSLAPGTFYEIQTLMDRFGPLDVVVINQMRNINVGREDRVNQLEKAATMSRNLAKKNDVVVVNVTQAGDSATNKLVLDMGDVDYSNTGIPGQMDLMIGVGVTQEFENRGQRMVSLPKNKMGTHAYFPVTLDTKLSKVTT